MPIFAEGLRYSHFFFLCRICNGHYLLIRVTYSEILVLTRELDGKREQMKSGIGAVVFLAALIGWISSSTNAAELPPRPAPIYAPPPVVFVFSWTGCYVGSNAGGLWSQSDWKDAVLGDFGGSTAGAGQGGLQVGCNYQVGSWVFGISADYDWTSVNNLSPNPIIPSALRLTDQSQIKALASVTGRVGYSWGRLLTYLKAGAAEIHGNYAFQVAGVPVVTASATQSGWTVGSGIEYAFFNWLTGFVEYDYYGFNNFNSGALVCTPAICGVAINSTGITTNINAVKLGLNFTLGPGGF
jgi:outer membrane immunogenic protein